MRLTLLNQFYAPDVAPTGQVLADLARARAARGHEVAVLASRASYDGGPPHPAHEERDGVRVRRLRVPLAGRAGTMARALQQAAFLNGAAAALLRGPRPDLVLSLTTPPFLGLWSRAPARLRRVRHANWVMDVYPDVLAAHGWIAPGGAAFRSLAALARLELAGASLVLGLGPAQSARVAAHAGREVPWVPLWPPFAGPAPEDAVARLRAERGWAPDDLVLLYSGNLGRGHAIAEFLEAARRLGRAGPLWAFCGGGARAGEVEEFTRAHAEARVQSLPYVAPDRLAESLAAGDVHLIGVRGGWEALIVPSKLQAAFAAARPALMVGPRGGDVAAWLEESGGGWRVDEGDVDGLLAALEQARDPGERARRGQAALAYARANFDRDRNCARIADLLEQSARGG
jgi:glycosyltransferase involved in cell wall biosynthesis